MWMPARLCWLAYMAMLYTPTMMSHAGTSNASSMPRPPPSCLARMPTRRATSSVHTLPNVTPYGSSHLRRSGSYQWQSVSYVVQGGIVAEYVLRSSAQASSL